MDDKVKEHLLMETDHLADAFWRNEQAGETRVNWFLTLVTAAVAGLASLTTAEHGPKGEALRLIIAAAFATMLRSTS